MVSEKRRWAIAQIILSDILKELNIEFNKLNIDYMPIKGAYLISTKLSEKLDYRKISDLDILVKPDDLEHASKHFAGLPQCTLVTWYKDNYRPTETVLKYKYKEVVYTIEIMDRINSENRFLLSAEDLFERALPKSKHLYYPSPEDALLIHICHLQSHIPFEFRETNTVEAELYIEDAAFNWERFWELAHKTGMMDFIIFFICFYNKDRKKDVILRKGHYYSRFLASWFTVERYEKTNPLFRRLFLDIPFVRKPYTLLFQKLFIKTYVKKRN